MYICGNIMDKRSLYLGGANYLKTPGLMAFYSNHFFEITGT